VSRRTALPPGRRDIVVVSIPLKNYRDVRVARLAGKIVIDTNLLNPPKCNRTRLDEIAVSDRATLRRLRELELPDLGVVYPACRSYRRTVKSIAN